LARLKQKEEVTEYTKAQRSELTWPLKVHSGGNAGFQWEVRLERLVEMEKLTLDLKATRKKMRAVEI
jgi:hypothetical protein